MSRSSVYVCYQSYMRYNPMPYAAACEMEVELGIALREAGYGVWQA